MTGLTLPSVPPNCRRRLTAHYGPQVGHWLDAVPSLLATVAERWSLCLHGYHDAGHASVLATATDRNGQALIVKAWPDRDRYAREVEVLRLWHRGADAVVRATDDGLAAAALITVGGTPGGAVSPESETDLVATALQCVHAAGRQGPGIKSLARLRDFVSDEVLPRIQRRIATTSLRHLAERVLPYTAELREDLGRETVLHADLYRENIPFTRSGRPVLLDPLPMVGDAAYDWAFWSLYYRLGHATGHRLEQAKRTSGIPITQILTWCLLLSLDGLLYYEETQDPRIPEMTVVLNGLLERAVRCPS
jgi:streptomycin 6-kinase